VDCGVGTPLDRAHTYWALQPLERAIRITHSRIKIRGVRGTEDLHPGICLEGCVHLLHRFMGSVFERQQNRPLLSQRKVLPLGSVRAV
jgi:hypothetical protein